MASYRDIGAYQEAGGNDIGSYEAENVAVGAGVVPQLMILLMHNCFIFALILMELEIKWHFAAT